MKRATVIICTYNRSDSLRTTLANFESLVTPNDLSWEILVIDNKSSDDTRIVVENFIRHTKLNVRYLYEWEQGKSFALNRGIREATGEIIAFTDDDILVRPDWLLNIIKALDENGCACVGGKILVRMEVPCPEWLSEKMIEQLGYLDLGEETIRLTCPKLYGANFAVSRGIFERYGYFDTNIGPKADKMYNSEDIDFIDTLIQGREKVLYCPDIVVEHVIPQHHIRKSYFRKRMLDQGELKGIRMGKYEHRKIMGIPLYFFREFIKKSIGYAYMRFADPKAAFQKQIECVETIGMMIGRVKYTASEGRERPAAASFGG